MNYPARNLEINPTKTDVDIVKTTPYPKQTSTTPKSVWLVVRAKPQMERTAEEEITKAGMAGYCPAYRYEFKHHRHKKWIVRTFPLFRGYIFLWAEGVDWYKLAKCKAVLSILRSTGGEPIGISDDVIKQIQARQLAGDFDMLRLHEHLVKPGMKVKVTEGPFTGLEGLVSSVRNAKAINMLIKLFGREVEAAVPIANLARKD